MCFFSCGFHHKHAAYCASPGGIVVCVCRCRMRVFTNFSACARFALLAAMKKINWLVTWLLLAVRETNKKTARDAFSRHCATNLILSCRQFSFFLRVWASKRQIVYNLFMIERRNLTISLRCFFVVVVDSPPPLNVQCFFVYGRS